MRKFIKVLIYLFSILIFLIIAGMVVFFFFVNPENVKTQLSKRFEAETGRALTIQSRPSLKLFPWVGLQLRDVQIANSQNFSSDQPFAEIGEASLYLNVMGLVSGKLEVGEVSFENVTLNLRINKSGDNNWADLFANSEKEPTSENVDVESKHEEKKTSPTIEKISFKNVQIKLNNEQTGKTFNLQGFNFEAEKIDLNHSFPIKISGLVTLPELEMQFSGDTQAKISMQNAALQLEKLTLEANLKTPQLADIKLLIGGNVTLDEKQFAFNDLLVKVNNTKASGRWHTEFPAKESRFVLNVDKINSANFVKKPAAASDKKSQGQSVDKNEEILPVDLLKSLDHVFVGELSIKELLLPNVKVDHFKTNLSFKNKQLKLDGIRADLYQGQLEGNFAIKVMNSPEISSAIKLKNLQVEPLLTSLDLVKQEGFGITGTLTTEANLSTVGNTAYAWKRNLNGNLTFAVINGVIKGIDLKHQVDQINTFINRASNTPKHDEGHTRFSELGGHFAIHNGIAQNNDLRLIAEVLKAKGAGSINLYDQTLDYTISLSIEDPAIGRDAYRIQSNLGGAIPIYVSGSFDNLKIQPDWEKITLALATTAVQKQLANMGGQIGDIANEGLDKIEPENLGRALSSLFG